MGKRSWLSKTNAGMLVGALAVAAVLYYVYGYRFKTIPGVGLHPSPMVGRGFGSTPYGVPTGNPGTLRGLASHKQGCGAGCHGGGGCCV